MNMLKLNVIDKYCNSGDYPPRMKIKHFGVFFSDLIIFDQMDHVKVYSLTTLKCCLFNLQASTTTLRGFFVFVFFY